MTVMSRRAWGAVIAVLISAWAVGLFLVSMFVQTRADMAMQNRDGSWYVTRVDPGSEASRAGIAIGDRITWDSDVITYRLAYVGASARPFSVDVHTPGKPAREVTLTRDGMLSTRIANQLAELAGSPLVLFGDRAASFVLYALPALLAALLVWRRLSGATLAFAAYSVFGPFNRVWPMTIVGYLPDWLFGPLVFSLDVLMSVGANAALLCFLARFPHPTERSRPLIRIADASCFVLVATTAVATFWRLQRHELARDLQNEISIFVAVSLVACAASSIARTRGEERVRIGWVLVGLAITSITYASTTILLYAEDLSQNLMLGLPLAALPIAVTYAVFRHRVLDLGFVVNRGIVYATLTAILLVTVGLVHWAVEHVIEQTGFAVALEVVVSVGFGLSLNWLHGRVEGVIDRVLFRRRHVALSRMDVRIAALDFATSAEVVDDALVSDAARILELRSAAVFRIGSGAYERTAATGWLAGATSLDRNHLLVRAMLAHEGARVMDDIDLVGDDMPDGDARPDLVIPVVLRHRLIAIALYGRKVDGTTIDAIERGLLERLARAAAGAYDAAEVARWSRLTVDAPALA